MVSTDPQVFCFRSYRVFFDEPCLIWRIKSLFYSDINACIAHPVFVIYDATCISITKETVLTMRNLNSLRYWLRGNIIPLLIDDVSNKKVSGFRGTTRIVLKYFPC